MARFKKIRRTEKIQVAVTPGELDNVYQLAEKHSLSVPDYIRLLVRDQSQLHGFQPAATMRVLYGAVPEGGNYVQAT